MSEVFTKTGGYMQILYTLFSLIALLTEKISLLNSLFNFNIKQKKLYYLLSMKKNQIIIFIKEKEKIIIYLFLIMQKNH